MRFEHSMGLLMRELLLNQGRRLRGYPSLHRRAVLAVNVLRSTWLIPNWFKFHFFSLFRERQLGFSKKNLESIARLKDRHKGKRCFIVGTGPSLNAADLDLIKDEITFSMNSIFLFYDKTDFRPDYYMFLDPIELEKMSADYAVDFTGMSKRESFFNDANSMRMKRKLRSEKSITLMMQWLGHWYNPYSNVFKFSDNLLRGVYDGYNSIYAAIQIARYMGCTQIYLLGADCGYTGNKKHFVNYSLDKLGYTFNTSGSIKGYEFVKSYSEKNGFKIYNATRGGYLNTFERVDLETVVKSKN